MYEHRESFMQVHYEFANAHERLLDAYHELFMWEANQRPPTMITPERRAPRLRRLATTRQAIGFTTPDRSVRRELFPDTPDLLSYETL